MRGEETQLLGALGLDARRRGAGLHARHAFQMGSHEGRRSRGSPPSLTGGLFCVVSRETILSLAVAGRRGCRGCRELQRRRRSPRVRGVGLRRQSSPVRRAVSSAAVRRYAVCGARNPVGHVDRRRSFAAVLSGAPSKAGVTLIASGRLGMLYRLAFDALSVAVAPIDADEAVSPRPVDGRRGDLDEDRRIVRDGRSLLPPMEASSDSRSLRGVKPDEMKRRSWAC